MILSGVYNSSSYLSIPSSPSSPVVMWHGRIGSLCLLVHTSRRTAGMKDTLQGNLLSPCTRLKFLWQAAVIRRQILLLLHPSFRPTAPLQVEAQFLVKIHLPKVLPTPPTFSDGSPASKWLPCWLTLSQG